MIIVIIKTQFVSHCKICCNQKHLNATKVTRLEFPQTSFSNVRVRPKVTVRWGGGTGILRIGGCRVTCVCSIVTLLGHQRPWRRYSLYWVPFLVNDAANGATSRTTFSLALSIVRMRWPSSAVISSVRSLPHCVPNRRNPDAEISYQHVPTVVPYKMDLTEWNIGAGWLVTFVGSISNRATCRLHRYTRGCVVIRCVWTRELMCALWWRVGRSWWETSQWSPVHRAACRDQWWIEGWATGAAAQGTKGGGHQRGESKNNANLHDEKRDW